MGGYGALLRAVRRAPDRCANSEAHVSECLAQVQADKPQLVADVSANLKNDLKDQPVGYSELYTRIAGRKYEKRKSLTVPQKGTAIPF